MVRKMTVEFEFEIGDMVYFKTSDHNIESRPNRFLIVERLAQQCPGGEQLHYKLAGCQETQLEITISKEMPDYTWTHPERREEQQAEIRERRDYSREVLETLEEA